MRRAHEAVRFVQNSIGAVPGPLDCFLVHRGLRTLHLRMAAHTENARVVAAWLEGVEGVVRHPLARALRDGLVPASRTRARIVSRDEGLLARGVAGRRRVADRGPAGDDAPVRRGLRRRRARPISCGSRAGSRRPRTWSRTSPRRSAVRDSSRAAVRPMGYSVGIFTSKRRGRGHPRWMLRIALAATTAGLATLGAGWVALGAVGPGPAAPQAAARRRRWSRPPSGEVRAAAAARATRGRRSSSRSPAPRPPMADDAAAADPGLTGDRRRAHQGRLRRRARQATPPAGARTPSTRRSRSATASRCRRWRRPRRSSRSSRPATASRARPTSGAAATASGRTRATTARARSRSRSRPPGC